MAGSSSGTRRTSPRVTSSGRPPAEKCSTRPSPTSSRSPTETIAGRVWAGGGSGAATAGGAPVGARARCAAPGFRGFDVSGSGMASAVGALCSRRAGPERLRRARARCQRGQSGAVPGGHDDSLFSPAQVKVAVAPGITLGAAAQSLPSTTPRDSGSRRCCGGRSQAADQTPARSRWSFAVSPESQAIHETGLTRVRRPRAISGWPALNT